MPHRVPGLIKDLYAIVGKLEEIFPGRPFTPDGHLVGSLGECIAQMAFDIELKPPSNAGHDAVDSDGRLVEVKATQGKSVAFRSPAEFVIVLKLDKAGGFRTIYNGPGAPIWEKFAGSKVPTNGQYSVSLAALGRLDAEVPEALRIKSRSGPEGLGRVLRF